MHYERYGGKKLKQKQLRISFFAYFYLYYFLSKHCKYKILFEGCDQIIRVSLKAIYLPPQNSLLWSIVSVVMQTRNMVRQTQYCLQNTLLLAEQTLEKNSIESRNLNEIFSDKKYYFLEIVSKYVNDTKWVIEDENTIESRKAAWIK